MRLKHQENKKWKYHVKCVHAGLSVELVEYFLSLVDNVLNGGKERERMTNLRDYQALHEVNPCHTHTHTPQQEATIM